MNEVPNGAVRLGDRATSEPPHELIFDAVRRSSRVEEQLQQLIDDVCNNPHSKEEKDSPTPDSSGASLASVLQATPGEIDSTTAACLALIDDLRGHLL